MVHTAGEQFKFYMTQMSEDTDDGLSFSDKHKKIKYEAIAGFLSSERMKDAEMVLSVKESLENAIDDNYNYLDPSLVTSMSTSNYYELFGVKF